MPALLGAVAILGIPAPAPVTAASNAIVVENQQPGTTSWQFTDFNKETAHEIEGYASLTSVNKGGTISFMVSLSTSAQYTMDFYRMGWYPTGTNPDGTSCAPSCGGRLMLHVGPLNGSKQAGCPTVTSSTDPNYGMIECNWTPSYTLTVPSNWTQGVYLVKLTRLDGTQLQNYMTFVVRDDSSTAPILYSLDTNTWQAYNFWGGTSNGNIGINLYGRFNDVTLNNANGSRAYTVSFDRPYLDQGSTDGAGNFFVWDFPLIRWMESQGYDMTYVTDTELESNPNLLLPHRVFVNTGHDEYYSDGMKSALQTGVNNGVNLALFSANNVYSRVTWSSDVTGAPLRRIHTSKGSLNDGTMEFRYLTPPQPENALLGVMQNGTATDRPFLVYDASSWIYAGTGLVNYTGNGTTGVVTSGPGQNALPGIVGYEFDERAANASSLSTYTSYEPAGLQQVGHSFVPSVDNGVSAWSDATLYTSAGGGTVFSAGTIQWPFTVDNGFADGFCDCDHNVANSVGQKVTSNILNRLGAPPAPSPLASLSPSTLTFASTIVGTTSAAQNVTLTNTGTAPMTISNIGFTGTNPGDYTQTNTCPLGPSTLAASASCTISVSFAPTATGTRTANLAITDDAPGTPQTVALTGTGAAATPAVTLTPTSLTFASQAVGTTSPAQTSTLKNTGTGPLTITSIAMAGTNSADYAQTNTCPISPSTLAANATCTISVTFKPTATGTRTANVAITDNASGSPQRLQLSGTGATAAPAVSFSPTSLTFSSQAVGTSSSAQSVTLTNSGNAALTITAISLTGTNAGDYGQTNTCPISPSTLAAGANCTISVTFTPTASGSRTANVSVTDNASGSPHTVPLSGTGTAPAVTLTPASLSFASQNVGSTSASQTSTLQNSGAAPLSISSITLTGTNPGDYVESSNCPIAPVTLAAGGTCSISVAFAPSAAGTRTASVSIADNASGSPQSLPLTGTGVATAPAVSFSPTSLTFSSQAVGTSSSAQSVTLTNSGNAALTITAIALSGTNPGDYGQTNTCPISPSTLAAGANCTISVTFTPTASGSRTANVSVTDNASGSPHTVPLSGTGTAPAVTLTPSSLTFASQPVGTTSSAQTSTLTNSGTAPLMISSIVVGGTNAVDYAQTNTCPLSPATLAVNATCTISVTFSPAAAGSSAGNVTITDNAGDSPQTLALSGTGAASAPAVTLTPASLSFGSQPVGTTSGTLTSTLKNTGNAALTISSLTVAGTNAGDYAQTNDCPLSPSTLAVNATCTISVTFTPSAAGSRSASVSVTDNASDSPQNLSLSGSGAAPAVSLSPSSLTYSSQLVGTTSASQSVTLTNSGGAPLTISSVGIGGTNGGDFAQTNTCPISPATLAAGANCTISTTFTPTAAGTRTASIQIADDAAGSPQSVALTGTGTVPAPAVTLTPSSLSFASQAIGTTSAAQTSTVKNTGTGPLTITLISVTGTNASDFTETTDCPTSPSMLAVNATCSISVAFAPTAGGSRTATVSITDDAAGSPQTIALSGTGAAPAVTMTPTSLSFGGQSVGTQSGAQTTTLKNSGAAPLTISSILITGANSGDYAQTNTCPISPATLAANATCTISVTFSPTAAGSRTASVTISDNAADTPQNVSLTGTGVAIAFDKNLGSNGENATTATMTLTTSATAAANTRVFLFADWNNSSRTLTSVSGGGLTWTVDVQNKDSSRYHSAIASANAPAGLPSGTVITATFSGAVTHGLIAAASFTGIAAASPVDITGSNTQKTAPAWTCSVVTTNPTDLVLAWSGLDTITTSTVAAPNIEIHDLSNSVYGESATSAYRIDSTTGTKTVNGTWASSSGSTANIVTCAAYKGG